MKKLNQLRLFGCICIVFTLLNGIKAEANQPQSGNLAITQEGVASEDSSVTPSKEKKAKKKKAKKDKSKNKKKSKSVSKSNVESQDNQQKKSKPNLNNPNEALEYRIEKLRLIVKSLKKTYAKWMQSGAQGNSPQFEEVDNAIKMKLIKRIKKLQEAYNKWLEFNGKGLPPVKENNPGQVSEGNDWKNEIPSNEMAFLKNENKNLILADNSKPKEAASTEYRLSKENSEKLHKELDKYRSGNKPNKV